MWVNMSIAIIILFAFLWYRQIRSDDVTLKNKIKDKS